MAMFRSTRIPSLLASVAQPPTVNRLSSQYVRVFSSQAPKDQTLPLSETVRDFLDPNEFYDLLGSKKMDFFTGVPDSLLKDFCAYVTDTAKEENHVMTANEGAAIATATGYHLATGKHPVVYMQNSGFGNCVNPLLSLTDPAIYSIPMLMMIGWRGEPGKKDEPQHLVQGKVMSSLLTDMGIQYEVLPDFIEGAQQTVDTALHYMQTRKAPYALLVKRQTFTPYKMKANYSNNYALSREDALSLILKASKEWDIFVSTTGFASREVYEYREKHEQDHKRDFLCVGSMGYASSIALGVAKFKPSRQVFCLDGDGAMFMQMGPMTTIGNSGCQNFKHIVINNGCHDSVGGQPTPGLEVDVVGIAKACNYKFAKSVSTNEEIEQALLDIRDTEGPALLEIRVHGGARKDLGRPTTTPKENKIEFMEFLKD